MIIIHAYIYFSLSLLDLMIYKKSINSLFYFCFFLDFNLEINLMWRDLEQTEIQTMTCQSIKFSKKQSGSCLLIGFVLTTAFF